MMVTHVGTLINRERKKHKHLNRKTSKRSNSKTQSTKEVIQSMPIKKIQPHRLSKWQIHMGTFPPYQTDSFEFIPVGCGLPVGFSEMELGTGLGIDTCGWEGRAAQGKGKERLQCRPGGGSQGVCVNCPWGVRELGLSPESSPELGGVSQPYNPSSWDDSSSRKRHLGDSSQKTVKFILKVG